MGQTKETKNELKHEHMIILVVVLTIALAALLGLGLWLLLSGGNFGDRIIVTPLTSPSASPQSI